MTQSFWIRRLVCVFLLCNFLFSYPHMFGAFANSNLDSSGSNELTKPAQPANNESTALEDHSRLPKSVEEVNQCLLLNNIKPSSPLDTFETADPLEPINRLMFEANQKLLVALVRKAGTTFEMIVPDFWRQRVADFSQNLSMPSRVINNLLQGKFRNAGLEVGRFLINSSLGIGGLFDSSSFFGINPPPSEDLGQTLGSWGFGPGIYLVVPFVGNTNLRDFIGFIGGQIMDPLFYFRTVVPGLRLFMSYNELFVDYKGKKYLRISEIVPDPYYDQKTLHDILNVALSCQ